MYSRAKFHQHFYVQLLRIQIPTGQKKTDSFTVFFALLGSAQLKAAHNMLVKSTPYFVKIANKTHMR